MAISMTGSGTRSGEACGAVTVTNVLTRLLRLSQLTGGFLGSHY